MIKIETERLILRNYTEADLKDIYEYLSLEEVSRYEDFYPLTIEQCKKFIEKNSANDSRLVAVLKETGKVIGSAGYFFGEDEDDVLLKNYYIDYDFNPKYGKKGYATEATRAVVNHIFNDLGGRRICADCDEKNDNSWKLLERLGFRREGHLMEGNYYKCDKEGNPIIINTYKYAMLKREFK